MGAKTEYVTVVVPDSVLVSIYNSVIGKIVKVECESRLKQLLVGCQLRKQGFKLYSEYLNPELSEQVEEWCSGRPAYLNADEFDLYIRCEKPHPVFGCKIVGHVEGRALQTNGKLVLTAELNNRTITIHGGVKNIFAESPKGKAIEGRTLISWSLTQNEKGEYDRYFVDFLYFDNKTKRRVVGFATVLANGDVVEMHYRDD